MKAPDLFVMDGRGYSWRRLCELRRQQLDAWKRARPQQPTLFALKDDRRPEPERTGAGRYREPPLLAWIDDAAE